MFAVAGDFFMNPNKKGYMTMPKASNGDIQALFLDKVVNTLKGIVGKGNNFSAVYSLGNHCYDGGDEFVFGKLKDAPMDTVVTNVNLEKSPLVSDLMKSHDNIVKTKVYEVQDDKNPNLKHNVMLMGITIPTLKGALTKTELYDNSNKKDTTLTESDLKKTFEVLNKQVEEFKAKHPKGAVVLLSHMGAPLSKMINANVKGINVILNGHDHTRDNALEGNTIINSLGKDNEIIKSVNLKFDDDGNIENTAFNMFETTGAGENKEVQGFLKSILAKDETPLIKLNGADELVYDDRIRYSNTMLTNYLTTSIMDSASKEVEGLSAVGLQSSYVRGGIKNGSTNLNLLKIFDGINVDSQNLNVGAVTGQELVDIVVENTLSNLKSPTRNTLIQWSDVQSDRTLIDEINSGKSNKSFLDAVKIRNQATGEFEPISKDKEYKIILSNKMIEKKMDSIVKVKDKFTSLNKNYDDYFRQSLAENNFEITINDKVKEVRVK